MRLAVSLGVVTTLLLCGSGGCRQDSPEPDCISGGCAQDPLKVAGNAPKSRGTDSSRTSKVPQAALGREAGGGWKGHSVAVTAIALGGSEDSG